MLRKIITALLIIFCITLRNQVFAQSDTLVMHTGETLTGEIKDLKMGVITLETDYSDSDFKIEWDKVSYLSSTTKFVITTTNGERYHGSLSSEGNKKGTANILNEDGSSNEVNIIDIVFVKSIDETFLSRIDLLMSVGYTLTKANNSHQFSGRLNAGYTASTFTTDLYLGIVRSKQTAEDTITTKTKRTEGGLGFRFFIVKDWFALISADFLQSTEQKLDLRSITKGGFGNYIVSTNKMYYVIMAGAAWNYEDYTEPGTADRSSAEAFAAMEYNIFDIGDLDLRTSVFAYPSLTEKGRFRTDFSFDLKYEFPLDFFINLGFTLNYDNMPVEGASESDYVLQTTFGWEL